MHVNPVTSDGRWTIGYDADGVAGSWPGNMNEMIEATEFLVAKEGTEFHDGNEMWDAHLNGDEIVWRDGSLDWTPIKEILRKYGDR